MGRLSKVGAAFLRLVAVAGPVLLGLLTALYIGRPSPYFLATGVTLAVAILACDGWIMARRHRITGGFALATQIAFLIFVGTYTASPLPAPSPISAPLPQASPPGGMAIYALPTGVNHRTASFAYRGGSPWDKRDSVATAVLVRHPQGDLLIDTGLGRTIAEQMREFPFLFRLGTGLVRFQAAADQLNAAGYDRRQLRYILLTHAHWDHVSGVPDFPGVPVLVTAAERRFIDEGGWTTANASGMNAIFQEYAFDGGPYMGFEQSRDLYGDGSIVIVPVPGHTPGSVAAFVTLPRGARYAFIGDLVWQLEGLLQREGRPWFEARQLHEDPVALQRSLLRMNAIATRFPQITMVPSHDPRGYASILEWSPVAARAQEGVKRTDLQQHDLGIPGREALQVRVDIAPGVVAPRHTHFGEEIIYVLEGTLLYEVEGKPPVTLKAGDVLFIPYGVVHSAKNIGSTNAAELATYVVEKGKPLVTLAK